MVKGMSNACAIYDIVCATYCIFQDTYKAPEEMQHSIFIGPAAGGGLLG